MGIFPILAVIGMIILTRLHFIHCYVINTDKDYSRWPNKIVPFIFTPGDYSTAEQNLILTAMSTISTDMGLCIQWLNLSPSGIPYPNLNFVIISRSGGPGIPSPVCYSYPGMITIQNGLGQHMSIQASCMSSVREVMRILSYLIGLRPEHNKPNRGSYITVNTGAATTVAVNAGAFNLLPNTAAILYNPNEFDYNSITMLSPLTYSASGAAVITSTTSTAINNIGRLSIRDCQALSFLYSCSITCSDYYGNGALPTQFTRATTLSTSPSSTVSSSSTPAPVSVLCSPNFIADAVFNDYNAHKLYFISNNLVYVVQNGQIIENGTPLSTDFPGPAPVLPIIAGYYSGGSVFLVDQNQVTFLYINNTFVSQTPGSFPAVSAATGYGNVVTLGINPNLAVILYVDTNGDISSVGINPSTSPKDLASLFTSNAGLFNDLNNNNVQEMYSVIDASGTEKVAFLYQVPGKPLQYFDAVPCVPDTVLDPSGQVCLKLSTSPRNFASTIAACNVPP
ncbi:hypothetical protein BV898_01196 [Hypsibius exemplaris]|uniref:Peptidase M12A domain-containing protein n=1 Tax=Hypsibius exemplaris TaxID=2072580 RepID=A0A1W0XC53_HYPEX|nr:hypothetical protein BV898_01196 [Hypsibius exemplaris]